MIEFLDINSLDDFRLNYETNHTSKDFQDLIINAQRYTQAKIVYPVKEAVRLARAWQDADSCHKKATKHKEAPPENADEDDPLTGTELKGHRKKFLARYSTDFFLDELTPSDKTVSRLYRECQRRTLKFPNLSKVTSISDESWARRVERQIGNSGLKFTLQATKERTKKVDNLEIYYNQMDLWWGGLSIVNADQVDDPPKDENGNPIEKTDEDPDFLFIKLPWRDAKRYMAKIKQKAL